jgi:chemotaxis protein methyltransferase CheR
MMQFVPAILNDKEFQRFSAFIYDKIGIKLPPAKKTMLEARMQKRLKVLGLSDFKAYADYVFSRTGQANELVHLIDVVTTNKTDFFREAAHFDFLASTVLPAIIAGRNDCLREPIRVWSAGCSSGEEPYTLAMVLAEIAETRRDFRFSILASDISTRILEQAQKAIYPDDLIDPIPDRCKKKYLLRSKDQTSSLVRICPEIRALVAFKRINFMDNDLGVRQKMDIIFCRNVVIYFDKATQQTLMGKFHHQLLDNGFLFIGHSESLNGLDVDFQAVASTVYRKA